MERIVAAIISKADSIEYANGKFLLTFSGDRGQLAEISDVVIEVKKALMSSSVEGEEHFVPFGMARLDT